jgi:hypothetical protein
MESFIVYNNYNLGGVFPPSAKAWTKLKTLQVVNDKFVGALPALNFTQMSPCVLFDVVDGGATPSNQFDCPFPAGALDNCTAIIGPGLLRPITAADCKTSCTGASTKLAQLQCNAWAVFYDAMGGSGWKVTDPNSKKHNQPVCSDTRTDPCSCQNNWDSPVSVCNEADTAVTQM